MTTDVLDEIKTTEDAVISALIPKRLKDLELKPYSLMRQVVALALSEGSSTFLHALMTVWVCTLEPKEVLKAYTDKSKAQEEAFEWGESLGFSIASFDPIFEIYTRLNQEIVAGTQAIEGEQNGEEPKNVGGLRQ